MRTNIQVFWTFLGVSRIKLEKILSFWRTLDLILEVLVIIPVSFRSCNSETRTDVHGFWSIQGFFYEIGENIVVLGNFRSYSICFYVLVLIPLALDLIPLKDPWRVNPGGFLKAGSRSFMYGYTIYNYKFIIIVNSKKKSFRKKFEHF